LRKCKNKFTNFGTGTENTKNNNRFIIPDKMYYYTVDENSQIHNACHDFKRPRFTINDLQK
jgi:hypothetical protein